jgi:hypothetical protein
MGEVGYFRSVNNVVHEFSLPLAEVYAEQATKGYLVRCNADGSDYTEDAPRPRPKVNASRAEWVGYAVSQGMDVDDAEAMTKADLVDKYGEKG